jgi:hypothetical protein
MCLPAPCPQLNISEGGTLNASELKQIKAGGDNVGLRAYDPGYVRANSDAKAELCVCLAQSCQRATYQTPLLVALCLRAVRRGLPA